MTQASRVKAKQALVEEIARTEKSLIRKKTLLDELNWDNLSKDAEEYMWSLIMSKKSSYYY